MSFLDLPFTPAAMGPAASHDGREFPAHTEVRHATTHALLACSSCPPRAAASACLLSASQHAAPVCALHARPDPPLLLLLLVVQVLAYLHAYADAFGLRQHITFNTRVARIDPVAADGSSGGSSGGSNSSSSSSPCRTRWRVTTVPADEAATATGHQQEQQQPQQLQQRQQQQVFDAVACCVGGFIEPSLPQVGRLQAQACPPLATIACGMAGARTHCWHTRALLHCLGALLQVPGMASWPGLQLHSHNYRSSQPFAGKRVLVVGASFSGG